jgi:hypothetical protein
MLRIIPPHLQHSSFTCSKCAQPVFLFTLNLFHVARNILIVNRIYVYCTDEIKSIRARKTITTDLVRLIIHWDLAEASIDDAEFFIWYNSLFSVPVIKSNYYHTSGYRMKKLRYINTQNIEPTCLRQTPFYIKEYCASSGMASRLQCPVRN